MTDQWNEAWSQIEVEIRQGLAEFDAAVPELIADGQAGTAVRALTISRDAALALVRGPEWEQFVRGLFDARIDELRAVAE